MLGLCVNCYTSGRPELSGARRKGFPMMKMRSLLGGFWDASPGGPPVGPDLDSSTGWLPPDGGGNGGWLENFHQDASGTSTWDDIGSFFGTLWGGTKSVYAECRKNPTLPGCSSLPGSSGTSIPTLPPPPPPWYASPGFLVVGAIALVGGAVYLTKK